MALAYTHIGQLSRMHALGSLHSVKAHREPMTRESPAGNRGYNNPATHGSGQTARMATEEQRRKPGVQTVHEELAGVLIGLKACIQVSIQRHRKSGREPDRALVDASTLADLAIATIRQLRVDLAAAQAVAMPNAAYP